MLECRERHVVDHHDEAEQLLGLPAHIQGLMRTIVVVQNASGYHEPAATHKLFIFRGQKLLPIWLSESAVDLQATLQTVRHSHNMLALIGRAFIIEGTIFLIGTRLCFVFNDVVEVQVLGH